MDERIIKLLNELVERVVSHFKMTPQEALEAVALAEITNSISNSESTEEFNVDEIADILIKEISVGK